MQRKSLISATVALGSIALAVTATAQIVRSVTYNGNVISHEVRVIDGRAFIPLSDAARALGGTVVKTDDGYRIEASGGSDNGTPAGGANQVNGLAGKVGQMLFTGKWRFEVLSVTTVAQYQTQYAPGTNTITPNGPNDELVVADCLVKNAQKVRTGPLMRTANPMDDSVTDDQGVSYPPIDFDLVGGGGYGPPEMLPGSASKFAVVFDVPKGTNLKDMVFSLTADEDLETPTDVRISIAQ